MRFASPFSLESELRTTRGNAAVAASPALEEKPSQANHFEIRLDHFPKDVTV